MLVVSGCAPHLCGVAVNGTFRANGTNHGKTAYHKDGSEGAIYYWDGRDVCTWKGWWIGPNIGAKDVWGYHPDEDGPPASGWHICDPNTRIAVQPITTQPGSHLCCFQCGNTGMQCLNIKPQQGPDECVRDMCKMHCTSFAHDCKRHHCTWQKEQDEKSRKERAPRRRGGQRARGERGPYEIW